MEIKCMKLNFKPMALLAMGLVLAVNIQAENEVTAVTSEVVEDIAFMLPDIQFVVLEDGRVKISMIGFRRQDIASFHFNELDITSDIELNIANKNLSGTDFRIDKFTDINNVEVLISPVNGFDMVLMSEIEPFALDGNVFSVKLTNGLEIRRTISFEESKGIFWCYSWLRCCWYYWYGSRTFSGGTDCSGCWRSSWMCLRSIESILKQKFNS
jgi:hypothetical protein